MVQDEPGGGWRDSDVIVHLRMLASWKGVTRDTLSLVTGSGGGDCGVRFMERGVWLIYGHRGKDGQLYTSICERTAPIERAREDSVALGKPSFDRLDGHSWASFSPPATCPVHKGIAIREDYSWPAVDLTPDARRDYPAWVEREAPWAAMALTPVGFHGGSLDPAWVCPYRREVALAWVGASNEHSTAPENNKDLDVRPTRAQPRSDADYRKEFPREQFAVQYQDGRQRFDSIESQFSRSFGGVSDSTIKFVLAAAEVDRLYEATVRVRLMDLATPHPAYPQATAAATVRTDRPSVLFVRCGIEVRQFRWYAARAPKAPPEASEWGCLEGVFREVQHVLKARPEVAALWPIPAVFDDPLRDTR